MRRSLFILLVICTAFIGAVVGAMIVIRFAQAPAPYVSIDERQKAIPIAGGVAKVWQGNINFEQAAALVTPAVVHIRSVYGAGEFSLNPLNQYFNPPARSSGSGVVVSDDGYVVTNYHVIEGATSIEVVMNNNQRFYARLVGADPSTDLALLKIKAAQLPFVRYGDSDAVGPGQWVLAIGNPFDLNSTVTAGIVSAKARNIGILRDKNNLQVEAFIQTDAAVNPGNSGGALVDLDGSLIGINSAIATATGSYSGYSFAIPVNLVKKVMDDLLEFGQVQRGLLGVQIVDVTAELAEEQQLDRVRGVFVSAVNTGSAAAKAGLSAGDVITAIDDFTVNTVSELQERVARHRPGHSVQIEYIRKSKVHHAYATLKAYEGQVQTHKREVLFDLKGAVLENLTYAELTHLNLDGGVRIMHVKPGPWQKAKVARGFIILFIDKVPVGNVEQLNQILAIKEGGILVEGLLENGERKLHAIDWR